MPTTDSISSKEPIRAPVSASLITCSFEGVCPSGAQPVTTVSQASRPLPLLASTNSSAAPVPVTLPENAAVAALRAFAALTFGVVARVNGAARPTELPA